MSMTRLLWRLNVPQVHKVPKPAYRYVCNVHPQFCVRFVCPLNVIRMSICNFAINKRIKSQMIQKRFRQLSFIIKCMIEAKKKNTHTGKRQISKETRSHTPIETQHDWPLRMTSMRVKTGRSISMSSQRHTAHVDDCCPMFGYDR